MDKKYELTEESIIIGFHVLHRIRALKDFENVKKGELGGFIESEENLSHYGNAWVDGKSKVFGHARVHGDAQVYGNAWVYGNAHVYGNAWVYGNARVYGNASVYGNVRVSADASLSSNADISSNNDYLTIHGLGSENRTTTFYKTKDDKISVNCGCFNGSISEFREKVKETHGDSKFAKEYLEIADLAEIHILE